MTREQRDLIRRHIDAEARRRVRRRGRSMQGMPGLPGHCYDAAAGDPVLALVYALDTVKDGRPGS